MAAENPGADPAVPAGLAGPVAPAAGATGTGPSAGQAAQRRVASLTGPASRIVAGAGLAGYCWLAGGATPFSTRALISVLVPGAVLGLIAFGRPPRRIPAPDSVDVAGFSYWLIAVALLFEWEASAFRDDSPSWHPALTTLINPLLEPHPVRSAAFGLWLLAGWALVRR
jgi:hypothetical protein